MRVVYARLDDLPPGMVFITRDGVMAVKSEYKYGNEPDSQWQCILLESGEYAHFHDGNDEQVKALSVRMPPRPVSGMIITAPQDHDAHAVALLWLLNKLEVQLWTGNDGSISWKWPADVERAAPIPAILRLLKSCQKSLVSLLRSQGHHEISPDFRAEIEQVLEKVDEDGD